MPGTIEELRERKGALLARREEELRLRAEGQGDSLALFIIEEELLDVNGRIRALDPRRRKCPRPKATASVYAMERQQYLTWRSRDGGDNRAALAAMGRAVENSGLYLSPRQREVFDLWRTGMGVTAIAERVGVNRSTVSRTLAAAKGAIRRAVELTELPVSDNGVRLDMSHPATAGLVLSCLTARQAVYLYLYYGEGLSLRETAALAGVDHAAVSRALRRGLGAVSKTLRYREAALDNLEVLGDLAYELFMEGFAPPEGPGPLEKGPGWAGKALGKKPGGGPEPGGPKGGPGTPETPPVTVTARRRRPERAGRLLAALTEAAGPQRLRLWLTALFERLKRGAPRESKKAARRGGAERKKSVCYTENTGGSTA